MFKVILYIILFYVIYRMIKSQFVLNVKKDVYRDNGFYTKDITKDVRIVDEKKDSGR
jgi:hypothetical protein